MADLRWLFSVVDQLSREELIQLQSYIEQKIESSLYKFSHEQLDALNEIFRPVREANADLSEEEIDAIISATITEVRNDH